MAKGYNRPVGGGGGGGMMTQLKRIQEQMEQAQAVLAEKFTTASVGGGSVKVTMSGDQKCKSVEIDPELVKTADAEMLQDLLLSAINLALEQSQQMRDQHMAPFMGGLPGMGL
jgi:DNA-binding YbaB/EbfC family protein